MGAKGYYSLVRFVPDAFRGEGVNLGVLLLCPSRQFFSWRITKNHRRALRFFQGEADAARLLTLGRGLAKRLKEMQRERFDPERLREFVRRHQDMLQLTEVRSCAVGDPEQDLTRLFSRLVREEEVRDAARAMNATQVRVFATEKFEHAGVLDRLKRDVEFEAHYRTTPYHFTFGYQNGGPFKLIHTTSFAHKEPLDACDRAIITIGEIEDVKAHARGKRLDFEVVGAFDPEQQNVHNAISTVFRDKKITLWEPDTIDPLVERVKADLA